MMKRFAAVALAFLLATPFGASAPAQAPGYVPIRSNPARDRIFYLLTVLAADPAASTGLSADAALRDIAQRRRQALSMALGNCQQSTRCIVDAMTMPDQEVIAAGEVLARLASPGRPLNHVVRAHLRPSGVFQRHAGLDDAAFMRAAWLETAAGLNRLYRVYALGEAPRYRAIDAMGIGAEDPEFRSSLLAMLDAAADRAGDDAPFFDPWSRIALDLLLINQRDEAARYEPLGDGQNRAALARARRLDWRRFRYSAIVVPGEGLAEGQRGLSPVGLARVEMATRRYRQGLAPFLIVSGGNVHPNRTLYNEAIEMKRALIERFGVPEHAILVDPYARHTTTNLRNAARLIYRAGAPVDMPVLVTTTRDQSAYIESAGFGERCRRELGYQPQIVIERLSPNDLAMQLNMLSLHVDPADPLDP